MNRVAWSIGIAAVCLLSSGCAALGPRPEVRDVRARITSIDLQGVALAFDVDVNNPYPVALKTPRFRYGIDIQDTPFVESDQDAKVELPAGKVGTATLPVRLSYKDLWKLYTALSDAADVDYRLRGAFLVDALGQSFELPISHDGKFPVLRRPTFTIKGLEVGKPTLSSAAVTLEMDVHNPNVFDVDVSSLGYAALLGDVQVGQISASTLDRVPAGGAGKLNLTGEITARSALLGLLRGESLGDASVSPIGVLKTPYGSVDLAR